LNKAVHWILVWMLKLTALSIATNTETTEVFRINTIAVFLDK
jgi:hypothetical protein